MDIEAFDAPGKVDERSIRKFIALAHKHHTHVLLSNHDFEGTPDLVEMMTRFFVMQELGRRSDEAGSHAKEGGRCILSS